MRGLLWTMIGMGVICVAQPVSAQTYDPYYPVCMQVAARQGGYVECSYVSMEQCRASASGRAAYCLSNPYFPVHPRARWR
jgi:hypothetical protein